MQVAALRQGLLSQAVLASLTAVEKLLNIQYNQHHRHYRYYFIIIIFIIILILLIIIFRKKDLSNIKQ